VTLPVLSKVLPAGRPATARLAKRRQCSSAVSSSRLCDTADSQTEQVDRQYYLVTLGKYWINAKKMLLLVVLIILIRQYFQLILVFYRPSSVIGSVNIATASNVC